MIVRGPGGSEPLLGRYGPAALPALRAGAAAEDPARAVVAALDPVWVDWPDAGDLLSANTPGDLREAKAGLLEWRPVRRVTLLFLPVLAVGAAVAGCGSSSDSSSSNASATKTTTQITEGAGLPAAAKAALHPQLSDFPATKGRTLQAVANTVKPGLQAGVAGENFAPGRTNRVPLGLLDAKTSPVYGPTAIYVASSANGKARGPTWPPATRWSPCRSTAARRPTGPTSRSSTPPTCRCPRPAGSPSWP